MPHEPVTTLAELDALDEAEVADGFLHAERGDPEPGANHSRAYHHGWRVRMMDMGELPIPDEHRALVRAWLSRPDCPVKIGPRRNVEGGGDE